VHLQVFDPHGEAGPAHEGTLLIGTAPVAWSLQPAPDEPGRWTVRATDRLSGGVAVWSFSMRPRSGGD
jgi:hypothetical protein